ncbi:MAG: 30S ribosomal protein S8 [Opitutales bacterium]
MMTDPIADYLTRIRNGINARKEMVEMPYSKLKVEISSTLEGEGFIDGWGVSQDPRGHDLLHVKLKYGGENVNMISGLKRASRPGRRLYVGKKELPNVLGGMGLAIMTTSRGVMSERKARELGVGGEVICLVW